MLLEEPLKQKLPLDGNSYRDKMELLSMGEGDASVNHSEKLIPLDSLVECKSGCLVCHGEK